MNTPSIPPDDLQDVMEMTLKIETCVNRLFKENELSLGMSALMSATINSIIGQCKTIDEVMFYRNIFMQIFDSAIRNIKIKKK